MVRQPQPSEEELEVVYKLVSRGLTDAEIREEMQEGTEFPPRFDPRYYRQRRREFNAAKHVLEQRARGEQDPILLENRRGHVELLVGALGLMSPQGLDSQRLPSYWHWPQGEPARYPEAYLRTGLELPNDLSARCLRSHLLPDDTLWTQHREVTEALYQFRRLSANLYGVLIKKGSDLGLPLRSGWRTPDSLVTSMFVETLYELAAVIVSGSDTHTPREYTREPVTGHDGLLQLRCGSQCIAFGSDAQLTGIEAEHRTFLRQLGRFRQLRQLRHARLTYLQLAGRLREALEVRILQRSFSGQCDVCVAWGGLGQ